MKCALHGLGSRIFLCALLLVAAVACGFPTEDAATPIDSRDLPAALGPSQPDASGPTREVEATLWFVDEERLVSVTRGVSPPATAETSLSALLRGASDAEQRLGLRSAIPTADAVEGVESERGRAIVELSPSFADIPAADQLFAVGQIVLTMTNVAGVGDVSFVVDGDAIAVPLPTGETSFEPLYRQQFISLREGLNPPGS